MAKEIFPTKENLRKIDQLIEKGLITKRKSSTEDLWVYNYTNEARFEDFQQSEELRNCRGLILDINGSVVARCLPKFWNIEQVLDRVPNEPFEVLEKMDGSLGIIYAPTVVREAKWLEYRGDELKVSTRGSMESEQAIHATDLLHYKYYNSYFDPRFTYLTEILYPENRIVVDYNGLDDLVLLAVIETTSGKELPLNDFRSLGLPLVKSYGMETNVTKLDMNRGNVEGYVLKFANGFRVKCKELEYLRLHRIMTALTSRDIWEGLRDGKPVSQNLDHVPDDIVRIVNEKESDLLLMFTKLKTDYQCIFGGRPIFKSRAEEACYYKEFKYPHLLFAQLDQKPIELLIWKMLKPKADVLLSRSTRGNIISNRI